MSYTYRLITAIGLLFSSNLYAFNFFVDALYWRATETIDWVLVNNKIPLNEHVTYNTMDFEFDPGFRIGVGYDGEEWDAQFYYTKYYTRKNSSAFGNLTSAFLAGKIIQPPNTVFYFQSGQVDFAINYNMFDFDLGKRFDITDSIMLRPLVGITGGWIDQTIDNAFQGEFIITENMKNNFTGAGPKMGVEGNITFLQRDNYLLNFFAEFSTSFLWGNWDIEDVLHKNNLNTIYVDLGNRHFGSLLFHGLVGVDFEYKDLAVKLGYEINDWFDQFQIFDDATGAHNNDLILQGATLRVVYWVN
jgi:hypothetical protein